MPTVLTAKSKKEVVSQFRQSEIIAAARKVFAEKGYIAATVDEIAQQASLAKGTIYVYFDSKERIYNAVMSDDLEALRRLTIEKIAAAGTVFEKISAYINARFEYCEKRRDFFRIMYIEPSSSTVWSKAKVMEWLHEPVRMLAEAVAAAIAAGEIRQFPPETLAWTVVDMTSGALQRRLSFAPVTTVRQDSDFLIDFVNAALRPSAS